MRATPLATPRPGASRPGPDRPFWFCGDLCVSCVVTPIRPAHLRGCSTRCGCSPRLVRARPVAPSPPSSAAGRRAPAPGLPAVAAWATAAALGVAAGAALRWADARAARRHTGAGCTCTPAGTCRRQRHDAGGDGDGGGGGGDDGGTASGSRPVGSSRCSHRRPSGGPWSGVVGAPCLRAVQCPSP